MATANPRLNVVLEPPLFKHLKKIARREGVSLSLKARDIIRHALEQYEDAYLARVAARREKTASSNKAISHSSLWAHLKHR